MHPYRIYYLLRGFLPGDKHNYRYIVDRKIVSESQLKRYLLSLYCNQHEIEKEKKENKSRSILAQSFPARKKKKYPPSYNNIISLFHFLLCFIITL